MDLAAASAEWQTSDSGVHEGAAFPAMQRIPVKLPHDGSTIAGKLDHTGYALFDVQLSNAPKLELTGGLPAGVAGGVPLGGRKGGSQWRGPGRAAPAGPPPAPPPRPRGGPPPSPPRR